MRILRNPARTSPCVLVLGMFDGVHRGHQQLLMTGNALAEAEGIPLRVCTFSPHPLAVLCPDKAPKMLTTLPEGAVTVEAHVLDACLMLYGKKVRLDFLNFQRSERKFDGVDALKAQIQADSAQARAFFRQWEHQ